MSEKVSLLRQVRAIETMLNKMSIAVLKKEGVRESEAEYLRMEIRAAMATLRAILPCEDAVRDTIRASIRAAE